MHYITKQLLTIINQAYLNMSIERIRIFPILLTAGIIMLVSFTSFCQDPPEGVSIKIHTESYSSGYSVVKEELTIRNDSIIHKRIVNFLIVNESIRKIDHLGDSFIMELMRTRLEYWKMVESKSRESLCDTMLPVIVTINEPNQHYLFSIENNGPNCYPPEIIGFMERLFSFLKKYDAKE